MQIRSQFAGTVGCGAGRCRLGVGDLLEELVSGSAQGRSAVHHLVRMTPRLKVRRYRTRCPPLRPAPDSCRLACRQFRAFATVLARRASPEFADCGRPPRRSDVLRLDVAGGPSPFVGVVQRVGDGNHQPHHGSRATPGRQEEARSRPSIKLARRESCPRPGGHIRDRHDWGWSRRATSRALGGGGGGQ